LIIDNSSRPYTLIAEGNEGIVTVVDNQISWNNIKKENNDKN